MQPERITFCYECIFAVGVQFCSTLYCEQNSLYMGVRVCQTMSMLWQLRYIIEKWHMHTQKKSFSTGNAKPCAVILYVLFAKYNPSKR